jgi:hypothetical protein
MISRRGGTCCAMSVAAVRSPRCPQFLKDTRAIRAVGCISARRKKDSETYEKIVGLDIERKRAIFSKLRIDLPGKHDVTL